MIMFVKQTFLLNKRKELIMEITERNKSKMLRVASLCSLFFTLLGLYLMTIKLSAGIVITAGYGLITIILCYAISLSKSIQKENSLIKAGRRVS